MKSRCQRLPVVYMPYPICKSLSADPQKSSMRWNQFFTHRPRPPSLQSAQKVHQLLQHAASTLPDSAMLQLVLSSNSPFNSRGANNSTLLSRSSSPSSTHLPGTLLPPLSTTSTDPSCAGTPASLRVIRPLLLEMRSQNAAASFQTWVDHLEGMTTLSEVGSSCCQGMWQGCRIVCW